MALGTVVDRIIWQSHTGLPESPWTSAISQGKLKVCNNVHLTVDCLQSSSSRHIGEKHFTLSYTLYFIKCFPIHYVIARSVTPKRDKAHKKVMFHEHFSAIGIHLVPEGALTKLAPQVGRKRARNKGVFLLCRM